MQHHTYTNILGKDNDLGYGIMRVDEDQPWQPRHLVQPLWNFVNACIFEYGIAMYDIEFGEHLRQKRGFTPELRSRVKQAAGQGRPSRSPRTTSCSPLLSGPVWRRTLAANLTANVARNLWSHSVIMCGHFPEGVETFEQEALDEQRDQGRVVPAPDARLGEHLRQPDHAPDERQPLPPDRAPPVPRPAEQPVLRDRPEGPGPVPALRAELQRPPAARSRWRAPGTRCCACPCRTAGSRRPRWSNAPRQIAKLFRSEEKREVERERFRPAALIAATI